jgi:lysophospholipase L1-like esterase
MIFMNRPYYRSSAALVDVFLPINAKNRPDALSKPCFFSFVWTKKAMRLLLLISLSMFVFWACRHAAQATLPETEPETPDGPANPPAPKEQVDILALGDSYTKGESVPAPKNFPNQLADSLVAAGYTVAGVRVIAQTGWRSDQLKNAIASQSGVIGDSTFSLVTLCIGVNNQYQGASFDKYKTEFEELLQTAILRAGDRKERVVVLSIPDWAYTTFGQNFSNNPAETSQEIDQYNAANKAITETYGVRYIDVTGISRQGLAYPDLVASDGLHPSALQYARWVKVMMPAIREALRE